MRALGLISSWFVTVLLFALFGWFSYDAYSGYINDGPFYLNLRFEPAVAFAAIGAGTASFIIAGLIVVGGVRSERLRRGQAGWLLLASAVVATILPGVVIAVIHLATPYNLSEAGIHLFQGEHGMWFVVAPLYTFWIILCALIAFLVYVFRVARW